jgi:hypothetical protein
MYFSCCSMYFCVVVCIVCFVSFSVLFVCMCTELLPPGGYPIAVKYIISLHIMCRPKFSRSQAVSYNFVINFGGSSYCLCRSASEKHKSL